MIMLLFLNHDQNAKIKNHHQNHQPQTKSRCKHLTCNGFERFGVVPLAPLNSLLIFISFVLRVKFLMI